MGASGQNFLQAWARYNGDLVLPNIFSIFGKTADQYAFKAPTAMSEPIRLAKRVAELQRCSRRDAELFIQGGWVQVDGVVVEQPQHMVAAEQVTVDPNAQLAAIEQVSMLMHRLVLDTHILPTAQTHSTADHSGTRPHARHFAKLSEVLPLEPQASGLVIFTQDRRFAGHMQEDGDRFEQEFIVETEGEIAPYGLQRLRSGLSFNGRAIAPAQVSWQNEVRLRFALKDVRPGQLESMCNDVGLAVVAIKRIRIGRIPLAKIVPGEWRYLDGRERF